MLITETPLDLDQREGRAVRRYREDNIAVYRRRSRGNRERCTRLKPPLPIVDFVYRWIQLNTSIFLLPCEKQIA
ncbi:hypothetical protein R69749_07141 [Paraburkholderia domus]|jgi:hypothetical protein|nr:hypothetical protein R70006_04856 [Paraburkholderia domus]CAE6795165.1 hypothetical protein R75483_05078 [Paraburkholderia domus]CAE6882796.1 hypothetical protein R69749_07141 [Paraburkholderia domus]